MNTEQKADSKNDRMLASMGPPFVLAFDDRTPMERLQGRRETLELTIKITRDELDKVNDAISKLQTQPEVASTIELLQKLNML